MINTPLFSIQAKPLHSLSPIHCPDRLSGNKLKLVQPELFVNNTNLVELELHDNPWECDCRLKNLVRWAKKRSLLQVRGREGREEGEGG